eukprot:scaffold5329_cov85-Skeletonema_menzelii.AAC.3
MSIVGGRSARARAKSLTHTFEKGTCSITYTLRRDLPRTMYDVILALVKPANSVEKQTNIEGQIKRHFDAVFKKGRLQGAAPLSSSSYVALPAKYNKSDPNHFLKTVPRYNTVLCRALGIHVLSRGL